MIHTSKNLFCVQRCHVHIATMSYKKILQLAITRKWRENKRKNQIGDN